MLSHSSLRLSFCLVVLLVLGSAPLRGAAESGDQPIQRQASSATVSVSSLAVPRKARKAYEQARDAARAQRDEEFERKISKALSLYPSFAEAYLLRADRENARGLHDAAIEDAQRARDLDPALPFVAVVLASAYNGKQQYVQAAVALAALRSTDANSWQAQYEMARASVGRGDVQGALHWSRLALQAAPQTCIDAHILVANALTMAHRWKEARAEFETYLASKGPLLHQDAVRVSLNHVSLLAEQQEQAARDTAEVAQSR